jgi:hypothetical protein
MTPDRPNTDTNQSALCSVQRDPDKGNDAIIPG